jgi:hypothetical protein
MRPRSFQSISMWSDWSWAWTIFDHEGFPDEERVTLTITPDFVTWDDYGLHQKVFNETITPWAQYHSDDGTGYVTVTDPGSIDVWLPASVVRPMGPGVVNVGLSLTNSILGTRQTLVWGRLPLVDTGGA